MDVGAGVSNQFSSCPLSRNAPELFDTLVGIYSDIVQLAVQATVLGTEQHTLAKLRTLARRAGEADAVPQDLIAVHLSALAILVKTKPQAMVRACVRQSRLLLVKLVGELALYYRDQAKLQKAPVQ